MKVLVTGVSGRFGPFVVSELTESGHEVVLFSRKPPPSELSHLPWIQGDIRDYDACLKACQGGIDAVQHLAAQAWPTDHPGQAALAKERGIPFDTTMQSNIMGTYYLLHAAVAQGVQVFVMTGSNCALGHGYRISDVSFPFAYFPVDEQHASDVQDSYSYSKLAGELLLASYTSAYGIRTYALRSAGICNSERRANMAAQAGPASGWNPWLWAWVSSEDLASAQRLVMEQSFDIAPHEVFFCNAGDTSAIEPTQTLIERFKPEWLSLIRDLQGHNSLLSNKKLCKTVGWQHKLSWRD